MNSQRAPCGNYAANASWASTRACPCPLFPWWTQQRKLDEIIKAANPSPSFVVMTEHTSDQFNTAATTVRGMHVGILFIKAMSRSQRCGSFLTPAGMTPQMGAKTSPRELLSNESGNGRLEFVLTHRISKAGTRWYAGVEVYNVYTMLARSILWRVLRWSLSYRSYPDLLFANFYRRPSEFAERDAQLRLPAGTGRHRRKRRAFKCRHQP